MRVTFHPGGEIRDVAMIHQMFETTRIPVKPRVVASGFTAEITQATPDTYYEVQGFEAWGCPEGGKYVSCTMQYWPGPFMGSNFAGSSGLLSK